MKLTGKKLRVVHFPNIPCPSFKFEVKDEMEAGIVIDALAKQHLFLYEHKFIPDYSNVIYVEEWNEAEQDWEDYFNEEEGMDWREFEDEHLTKTK